MELVSDLCLLLLILHTPTVLALSTRKLRAGVRRCAAAVGARPRFGAGSGGGPQTCFNQVSRCAAVPAVGSKDKTSVNCDFSHGAREFV